MGNTTDMKVCTCEGTVMSFDTAKGHGILTQAINVRKL